MAVSPYLGVLLLAAAAAVVWAARLWPTRTVPAPVPGPRRDESAEWLPCHSLSSRCGHMTTPHDRTESGLVCRYCQTVTEVTQ